MEIFQFDDYKECIRFFINASDKRGYQSLLAEAAGCQRAFLSQVLNSHIHLTPEHAAGICRFWGLSDLETDFFLELVAFSRAGTEEMRSVIKRRLSTFRKQNSNLSKKLLKDSSREIDSRYYSSWEWVAIHVLVSIPEYQTLEVIVSKLHIPKQRAEEILSQLQEMGVIVRSAGKWRSLRNDVYLKRDSHMTFMNHWNWRNRALADIQSSKEESLHYTAVLALSRKDILKFRSHIVDFLKTTQELVAPSPEEEMICFTCDFFEV